MTTLKERLEELMADYGLTTQQQLADFAEVSKGLVGQWFSGSTGLGKKPLLAFERKTNFSAQWLSDGTGNKYKEMPMHETMTRLYAVKKLINDKFDGNQADFARAIQKAPAQVNQWLNGYRNIGDAVALHIEKSLNLPIGFLDGEQGEMHPAHPVYIPPAGGIAVLEETDTTYTHRQIEMYDLKLSAGGGNAEWVVRKSDDPLVFRDNWFRARKLNQNDLRGMHIKGDSMSPVLNNHDTVIIDIADTELVDGEIYAVVYKEKFFIKQIRHLADGIELISFNPEYEPMPVQNGDAEKFQCLGRMVWRGG